MSSDTGVETDLTRALRQLEDEQRRSADLAAALAGAQLQVASLEQRLRVAEQAAGGDLAERLRAELDEQRELAEQYRIEVADLRSMFDAMQHRIDVLGERAGRESQLRDQVSELEAQRQALADEVQEERRKSAALAQEARPGDVVAPLADGLQARYDSLQKAFDAAVARHAHEARALREEAELHKALVRDRDTELARLSEECSILQQSVETTITELEGVRAEHHDLSAQLRKIENGDEVAEELDDDADALVSASELRLVDDAATGERRSLASNDLEQMLGDIAASDAVSVARRIILLNLDDDPTARGSVERAVSRCENAVYRSADDGDVAAEGDVVLAVNLASDEFDLNAMANGEIGGVDEPEAFAYCAKGGRGVFFRRVMFFPPPCDLDECAARLLTGADGLQRILAVGEDVDFMSGLRESLGRVRTSTAIAFDGRQAVDLIPMVKPQMVLVDLNLPRGGGLRVASQIAANPELRNVAIAMFWSRPLDPAAFRQQAVYALRDVQLDAEQLTRSVAQMLDEMSRRNPHPVSLAAALPAHGSVLATQAGG